ncbi:hypothetical protein M0R45_015172 [Rubus argutus]|uniref:Ribosomal protein S19 n=1 Tax=Rubus argutus TaxID=59490 RepID=A0AAW1XPS6_RUBAR
MVARKFYETKIYSALILPSRLDLLSSKTWHLEKDHGFNFFPGTQSIEVLAVFKRGQGVSPKKKKSGKKKKRL